MDAVFIYLKFEHTRYLFNFGRLKNFRFFNCNKLTLNKKCSRLCLTPTDSCEVYMA